LTIQNFKTPDFFLLGIFLPVIFMIVGCTSPDPPAGTAKPNILLVTLDTTRADRLGCYGYELPTSPRIDAFAEDAVLFESAVSTSAVTPVSHASILSGYYQYRHGVRVIYAGGGYRLPDTVPTLADMLGDQGWNTGAFLSSFTVSEFYGFDRGFDHFDCGLPVDAENTFTKLPSGKYIWPLQQNQRRSDETVSLALNWLEQVERPFFLWVHFWDPHDAAILPPVETMSQFISPDAPMVEKKGQLYDAEIRFMDAQFGKLLDYLEASGEYDRTIITLVSDHGEGLGDHGWWFHRLLYQEQIRIPLIMRLPSWPKGRRIGQLARTIDIVPTVLNEAGLETGEEFDGKSLVDLIDDSVVQTDRIAYADAINKYDMNTTLFLQRPLDDLIYCVTDGSWKLLFRPNHPDKSELFDLVSDPGETLNLYAEKPRIAADLKRKLDRFGGYVEEPLSKEGEGELDPGIIERLRTLGYVDD